MLVFFGALAVNIPFFRYILSNPRPKLMKEFSVPRHGKVDMPLIVGGALFGLGWGFGGICPGPAIVGLASGNPLVWIWVLTFFTAVQLHSLLRN